MSARRSRRGGSLIEVLVALAIIALIAAGTLQVFSLSLVQSYGSNARTQLTYKCQQVVEIVRLSQFFVRNGQTAFSAQYGIKPLDTIAGAGPQALPYDAADATWSAWGPAGANVVEQERDAYLIYYVVESVAGGGWQLRVTAIPVNSPEMPLSIKPSGKPAQRFLGKFSPFKKVEYVAQVSQF